MEEGSLAKWYVSPGDKVKPGDIIADIETDKALMEYESIEEGTIVELIVKEGTENIKVNSLIAVIETEGAEEMNTKEVDEIKKIEPVSIDNNQEVFSEEGKAKSVDTTLEDSKSLNSESTENQVVNELTVREAINSAIAEEMRLDEDVFLIGEEVGEYQGAYKVSQGLLEEFGSERVIDTCLLYTSDAADE